VNEMNRKGKRKPVYRESTYIVVITIVIVFMIIKLCVPDLMTAIGEGNDDRN
jgi:hypothetical protein